jgi:hypothetical protein
MAMNSAKVPLVSLSFDRDVPENARFYEAHFKLDVLKHFGSGSLGDHVGLIDADMVLLRPFAIDDRFWAGRSLLCYDISDSFLDPGEMLSDLSALGLADGAVPRWFGGEFIVGSAEAFKTLSHYIDRIWPLYRARIGQMSHVGDEPIVSAALCNMQHDLGDTIHEIGEVGDVHGLSLARWWSSRTNTPQLPLSSAVGQALLHMPADKIFLAKMAGKSFERASFIRYYRSYVKRKLVLRRAASLVDRLLGKRAKFLPTM